MRKSRLWVSLNDKGYSVNYRYWHENSTGIGSELISPQKREKFPRVIYLLTKNLGKNFYTPGVIVRFDRDAPAKKIPEDEKEAIKACAQTRCENARTISNLQERLKRIITEATG